MIEVTPARGYWLRLCLLWFFLACLASLGTGLMGMTMMASCGLALVFPSSVLLILILFTTGQQRVRAEETPREDAGPNV